MYIKNEWKHVMPACTIIGLRHCGKLVYTGLIPLNYWLLFS